MSQPVLIAMLALAIAIAITVLAAVIASATDAPGVRTIKLAVLGVVLAVAIVVSQYASLRVNFTGSMPVGIYALVPLPPEGVRRGMLVAVCAPVHAAEVGLQRGYLTRGPCPAGTEFLLKAVVAVADDDVVVTAAGVAANGCLLLRSRPIPRDRSGRRLTPWPPGHYRLRANQLWLYADSDRSWDSRYWGPAPAVDAVARAVPLLVFPLFHSPSGQPGCSASLH